MASKPILISNFFNGGLSDSRWSGVADSLYRMVGLDPHSEPAVAKAEQKLTKETTGVTPDEFCKWQVVSSNGHTYHFSSESGKIWERDDAGAWTLVYTTAGTGDDKCLGAIEFQGYIIWATAQQLHRILASAALGAAGWATIGAGLNWLPLTATTVSYHPMIEQNMNLYIGDGYNLAEVDDAWAFTASALDLPTSLVIKCLGTLPVGTDILIGTEGNDVTKTAIFRWNGWSVSFTSSDMIEESGINAFLKADNFVYVSAGQYGNIYTYNGQQLELYKKVQGVYSPTAKATVHPDAVANLDGQVLFGVSNSTGNPCLQGVYRIGRNSRNYPWIMDLPYPISERSGTDLVMSGIEIGSIIVLAQKILVSWKNGSTSGVDLLDASNKLNGAYFETRVMRPDRLVHSTYREHVMAYNSLPASTALTLYYDKNYAGSYTTPTSSQVTDTDRKLISLEEGIEAIALQLKVVFTCSGNSTPSLESLTSFLT